MKVKQIGLIFLLLWLSTFVASFIAPRWIEPTGDGFTRGLNRIGHWMGWQFAATLLAITCCIIALRYFRPNKRWKLTFLIPIFGQISLVLLIAGVIVYTRFRDAPPPVETAPPEPTAAADGPSGKS